MVRTIGAFIDFNPVKHPHNTHDIPEQLRLTVGSLHGWIIDRFIFKQLSGWSRIESARALLSILSCQPSGMNWEQKIVDFWPLQCSISSKRSLCSWTEVGIKRNSSRSKDKPKTKGDTDLDDYDYGEDEEPAGKEDLGEDAEKQRDDAHVDSILLLHYPVNLHQYWK